MQMPVRKMQIRNRIRSREIIWTMVAGLPPALQYDIREVVFDLFGLNIYLRVYSGVSDVKFYVS